MSLTSPNLDDRDFAQLLDDARRRIARACPQWTDLSPSDPGMVLLELFAHLTETMIYRLNRLPEKAYVEFLRLMGVKLRPPVAAAVTLRFSVSRAPERPVEIPRGTRVSAGRAGGGTPAPVFITARTVGIAPGATAVEVAAHHCDLVEAELAGMGTGLPRQFVTARRPPIIAPSGHELDLVVGVETSALEVGDRAPALQHDGKKFRIWREVENFTEKGPDGFVFVTDRITGTVTFAPAVQLRGPDGQLSAVPELLADVPAAGREIRLWYRSGGGPDGNVAANVLTTLKDPIPGVQVTNPERAAGGRAAETLENALVRGPQELHSLQRAVTARDFELVALQSGAVARARAVTRARLWKHASPGTVEVLLVPYHLAEEQRGGGAVTAEVLHQQENEHAREWVQAALDERRPLGTACVVSWVRYKTVRVQANVVVHRGEDAAAVRARVLERLHQTINPLPTPLHPSGWPFGEPLRASQVYDIVLKEPGVRYVDQVRLLVDEVPGQAVASMAVDAFQPRTWYVASGSTLFRSLNDGDGWEPAGRFPGEAVDRVEVSPQQPGLLGVVTRPPGDGSGAQIHVSGDCGETWRSVARTAFAVHDLAWLLRDGSPVLLMATDKGLYELAMRAEASPIQILVDPADPDRGLYSVAVSTDIRGTVSVAVAAQAQIGVFVSSQGGKPETFASVGLQGEDVRVLAVQYDGPHAFLWAGVAVGGNEAGKGCFRWPLTASAEGWRQFRREWAGGSCRSMAFRGPTVFAATHHSGVVRLDSAKSDPAWQAPPVGCGLPTRDREQIFHPVDAVGVGSTDELVLAGGPQGVYRSPDGGVRYETSSSTQFAEKVTLPDTWLFCSGTHDVVVREDETRRD